MGKASVARKDSPKPVGPKSRPSIEDPAVLKRVVEALRSGLSIRKIGTTLDPSLYPEPMNMYYGLYRGDEIATALNDARSVGQEAAIDETRDIANEETNADNVLVSRLRINTYQWIAAKLNPRRYGDRTQVAATDVDGGPVIPVINITVSKT